MVNTSAQELLSSGVAAVLRTVEKVGKSKRSAHTSANGRKPFYSIKQVGIPTKARAGLFKNRVAQFWMASVGFTNGGLVRLAV